MGWGLYTYIKGITAGIFLVPMVVHVVYYGLICRTICRNLNRKARCRGVGGGHLDWDPGQELLELVSTKLRTDVMTFMTVVVYVVCWAPFFTTQIWSMWTDLFCFLQLLKNTYLCEQSIIWRNVKV